MKLASRGFFSSSHRVTTTEKVNLPGVAWPEPEWAAKVQHHRIVVSLLSPATLYPSLSIAALVPGRRKHSTSPLTANVTLTLDVRARDSRALRLAICLPSRKLRGGNGVPRKLDLTSVIAVVT